MDPFALIRDLFPSAFPTEVDFHRQPLVRPGILFGACSNDNKTSVPFDGIAFWTKEKADDKSVYVDLVSCEPVDARVSVKQSIENFESKRGAFSLDTQDLAYIWHEFHIVGRASDESYLERKSGQEVQFLSWDKLIQTASQLTDHDNESEMYRIVIDEIIRSARHILRRLIENPNVLCSVDHRRFEEIVAVLLSDLGFRVVELTPPTKDKGRDIVIEHKDPTNGLVQIFLVECKHWTSGKRVSLELAYRLQDVVNRDGATAGILLATSDFSPTLIHMQATLRMDRIFLKGLSDFREWLSMWERTFGSLIYKPLNPQDLFHADLNSSN